MPFTTLRNGTWGIQCSGRRPSESETGVAWQRKIQLQVLEDNAHYVVDFEPEYAAIPPEEMVQELSTPFADGPPQSLQEQPSELNPALHQELPSQELQNQDLPTPDPTDQSLVQASTPSIDSNYQPSIESAESNSGQDTQQSDAQELTPSELNASEAEPLEAEPSESNPLSAEPLELERPDAVTLTTANSESASSDLHVPEPESSTQATSAQGAAVYESQPIELSSSSHATADETSDIPEVSANANASATTGVSEISDASEVSGDPNLSESADTSETSLGTELPTNLPIDLEALSPDIRQDIANVFQTVDAMAEEILASIDQQITDSSLSQLGVESLNGIGQDDAVVPQDSSDSSQASSGIDLEFTEVMAPADASSEAFTAEPSEIVEDDLNAVLKHLMMPNLQIALDQDAWTLQRDCPLTLTGSIQHMDTSSVSQGHINPMLCVRLTDPQNGALLSETIQSLTLSQDASTPFSLAISDIQSTQAHIVLGEVTLSISVPQVGNRSAGVAADATQSGAGQMSDLVLATQAFVVAVELEALLGAIAQPTSQGDLEKEGLPPLDPPLAFVEPDEEPAATGNPDAPLPRPFRVSDQSTLPPKLQPDQSSDATEPAESRPPLDLPDFVKSPTSLASSILGLAGLSNDLFTGTDASTDENSNGESRDNGSHNATVPESVLNDWLQSLTHLTTQSENNDDNSQIASDEPQTGDTSLVETVRDLESTAKLTDHESVDPFDLLDESENALGPGQSSPQTFSVSENLAQQYIPDYSDEITDSDMTQVESAQADVLSEDILAESPESSNQPSSIGDQSLSLNNYEIVVEDDVWGDAAIAPSPHPIPDHHELEARSTEDKSTGPNSLETARPERYSTLPDHIDVPTPTIECVDDELVAGESFRITVTLPNLGPRIFVKLWIQDRQTRTLLDGPRWLADFITMDDDNTLEARTQLTIPLGAVDVRLEAIAMEMMTQRESRKVSLDRAVVPPDLPVFSLDDLT